jgi:hypothetical protein
MRSGKILTSTPDHILHFSDSPTTSGVRGYLLFNVLILCTRNLRVEDCFATYDHAVRLMIATLIDFDRRVQF